MHSTASNGRACLRSVDGLNPPVLLTFTGRASHTGGKANTVHAAALHVPAFPPFFPLHAHAYYVGLQPFFTGKKLVDMGGQHWQKKRAEGGIAFSLPPTDGAGDKKGQFFSGGTPVEPGTKIGLRYFP